MSARVFKFCIHNEDDQVDYCNQNQGAEIYFCLLFLFFPFFYLSLQGNEYGNFCQRFLRNYLTWDFEIWYKHQVWQVVLCIKESATYGLSVPLFVHFSFFPTIFPSYQLSIYECYSLQILYTGQGWPSVLLKRKPWCWDLLLPSFSIFSLFLSLTPR